MKPEVINTFFHVNNLLCYAMLILCHDFTIDVIVSNCDDLTTCLESV